MNQAEMIEFSELPLGEYLLSSWPVLAFLVVGVLVAIAIDVVSERRKQHRA